MSSYKARSPDAPTRLAEHVPVSDRFETQVYYARAINKYLIIDRHASPSRRHWVAVRYLKAGRIAIERFHGQRHIGVVRVLTRFQLIRSEWWAVGIVAHPI